LTAHDKAKVLYGTKVNDEQIAPSSVKIWRLPIQKFCSISTMSQKFWNL
jgi:hypothetical protein